MLNINAGFSNPVRQSDGEFCSLAELAFNLNRAFHQLDQLLDNRHSESRAVYTAFRAGVFTGELIEHIRQKFHRHTDARVLDFGLIHRVALALRRDFREPHCNFSARRRVLQRVAQDIEENLAELCCVAENVLMFNVCGSHKLNSLLPHLRVKQRVERVVEGIRVPDGFIKRGFSALNPRHFEDVVD